MSYDQAIVRVLAAHDGVVDSVKDLVDELDEEGSFELSIVDEEMHSTTGGVDGSKVLTVEVNEYVGEIPLFTAKVRETVAGATVENVDVNHGESEVEAAQ